MNELRGAMLRRAGAASLALALAFGISVGSTSAQTTRARSADPGLRGGPPAAGGPMPGLSSLEAAMFRAAQIRFQEVTSVFGGISGEFGSGLGPRFNLNGCAGCHAAPSVGGSSPASNPQIAVATLDGARNTVPSFLSADGPVREVRFVTKPDGSPDGGVHQLFVITGRSDAKGCALQQPDFATAQANGNIAFRIPTPLFGLGLVEATPDTTLQASFDGSGQQRSGLGIGGHFNVSGNDGTITRFGWKAQNKSLLMFAGEAYNVEQGVSNEVFPNEVNSDPACAFNGTPEDATNLTNSVHSGSAASDYSSDVVNFAAFARLSAPPAAQSATTTTGMGQQQFQLLGCNACHTMSLTTGLSKSPALSHVTYAPFSDFAVHHMGNGLADGIGQGAAGGDEFRTAPLWGLGQRLFFLHDGRTADLDQAIMSHASQGSEANAVIGRYRRLSPPAAAALLQYLRSL